MGIQKPLPSEGAWNGQPCYVIGGGSSLKAFDWNLLRDKAHQIAINMALLNCPWADIWFSEDHRVITELITQKEDLKKAWGEFKGIKVWHCLEESLRKEVEGVSPDVHIIERKYKDKRWSKSFQEGLSYSSNSAIGALNIASILGADPIYLLGIDCRLPDQGSPNYHDLYPHDWRMPRGQEQSYASDFTHWAALHLKGRSVVNLINPEFPSALECWPRVPWGDVL